MQILYWNCLAYHILWSVCFLLTVPWDTLSLTCHLDKSLCKIASRWSSWDFFLGKRSFLELIFTFLGLPSCFARAKSAWEVIFLKTCVSKNVLIPNIWMTVCLDIGNPLQCSCLENPRDGGAWWAGCRLWGCTESDTSEATWQQQQQHSLKPSAALHISPSISWLFHLCFIEMLKQIRWEPLHFLTTKSTQLTWSKLVCLPSLYTGKKCSLSTQR